MCRNYSKNKFREIKKIYRFKERNYGGIREYLVHYAEKIKKIEYGI